ncbi:MULTISPECIES: S1/P1 nuclease [Myroides]|uniref:S1/P1 Nuclease n=1 Tax=Myroides albus TaxID=2562892 RepID=A0A6I3LI17_9FLAO|nr:MULTISPECIES: S1/P1 nuclease [Myroides]MTG97893.1 S1/P1 Nuclease [Myroides albus]MVX36557.1 S1/P1 Nuclease [Myroides sp. LoEW2-1]UVD81081.1 S1/P1 nuclease [Myroides albus]
MKKLLYFLIAILFTMQTTEVFAWGTTGHRVVSEIAERNLTKKAKKEISKIIGKQKLAYWSNWPDFLKSDPSWKFSDSWHYVNLPGNLDRAAFDEELAKSTDENLYKRTLLLIEELKSDKLSLVERQQKLYFLIHIIGDAHQPLHIGRLEDLGGNRVKVEWFRKPTNLHSLWDSALVDFDKYSYTEYATVLDVHSKEYNNNLTKGSLEDWLFDSYSMANKLYDSVEESESLSYRYHFDHKDDVEIQLLKGGLRLAQVLNEIFK